MTSAVRKFHPLTVTNPDFWARSVDEREHVFKQLRDEDPVSWHPPMEGSLMESDQQGMWVATRHEHITEISMNPDRFCSGQGVQFEDIPEDLLEASQSFLAMDDPRHQHLRRLVSVAFTPKQVTKINDQIAGQARRIVDDLLMTSEGDFVQAVSRRLPMWTIYEMVGLNPELRDEAAHMADEMVSFNDPEVAAGREPGEILSDALVRLLTIGLEFAEHRRRNPADDLMTNLVQAEVDGARLTDDEIAAFFVLLSVAGNDTTRNSISLTTRALQENPDQKAWLLEDFDNRIASATDEFIRWASPVMTFRRTATQDTVLGGRQISKGDWVAMIYSSGNRDERAFDNPHRFDLSRPKNPHIGFGGGGPHFCMGNFVAKMQIRHLFHELLTRAPGLVVGEPEELVGSFVRAVKKMPYTLDI
ncbi:cytochrome P450 [Nocardia fluminea]|uniref:cytochrome P450 n=1 Tax=Nocardia fluminea TaxID=134984 RepID=UPI0038086ABB